jgi:hypothetical protein
MKKNYFIVALLLSLGWNVEAQQKNISGIWEGKLNAGITIRIVFHLNKGADGVYTGTMDSPDQGARGLQLGTIGLLKDSVIIEVPIAKGYFRGLQVSDSLLNGVWLQGPAKFPLQLKHVLAVSVANRPQTPKPPFSYVVEDLVYNNADNSMQYGASFTYPASGGPFPTAILITGSGQQDRDETILEHKPFAIIADYLTKNGYAVLRVDDRGIGKSSAGNLATATSLDFASDVENGLRYLKTRKQVDTTKIGLIGHSEGGLIASIVASRNRNINFVIMLAGPGIKGAELLTLQMSAILKSSGIAGDVIKAYEPLYRQMMDDCITQKDTAIAFSNANKAFQDWKARQPASTLNVLGFSGDETNLKIIRSLVGSFSSEWMKYFLLTDPQPFIEKFHCSVLAMNGSRDVQVLPLANLAGIKVALEKSKSRKFETIQLEGLNHLFQHCKSCSPAEYGLLEESFAPEALEAMGKWLGEIFSKKK